MLVIPPTFQTTQGELNQSPKGQIGIEKKNNIYKRFIIKAQDSFPLETDGQAKAFGLI